MAESQIEWARQNVALELVLDRNRPCTAIVLAAGQGTRMRSPLPKVVFDVCGLPAVVHVLRAALAAGADRLVLVVGVGNRDAIGKVVAKYFAPDAVEYVIQQETLGTGHAVRVAIDATVPTGDVLVLYGDGPLYSAATLRALMERHRETMPGVTLLTAEVEKPQGYGRIVTEQGRVRRIVEELDATAEIRAIHLINTGILVMCGERGTAGIRALRNDNAKREFYLTDLTAWMVEQGHAVEQLELADAAECASFNSIEELAEVRARMRRGILLGHMRRGVDVVDPATAYIDADVEIGEGSRILPCCVIAAGVRIGRGCVVGPFAQLREGTVLEDGAEVGNFTELKKTRLGRGSKAKHLTYLGDTSVGVGANIGCGTITANYDGKHKHHTEIGDRAFIGSGTVLIAPCQIGAAAVTGAGAVVRKKTSVEPGAVYVGVPARRLERPSDPASGESR